MIKIQNICITQKSTPLPHRRQSFLPTQDLRQTHTICHYRLELDQVCLYQFHRKETKPLCIVLRLPTFNILSQSSIFCLHQFISFIVALFVAHSFRCMDTSQFVDSSVDGHLHISSLGALFLKNMYVQSLYGHKFSFLLNTFKWNCWDVCLKF